MSWLEDKYPKETEGEVHLPAEAERERQTFALDSPTGAPAALSIGQTATLACLLEASAPKPGNVHRGADFADMTFYDFASSAVLIAPAMDQAEQTGVGRAALRAIQATRGWLTCNTNLGTVLLLAPLAVAAARQRTLNQGPADFAERRNQFSEQLHSVLASLSAEDARHVYEAIRGAQPGGLGRVPNADIADAPPRDLRAAMQLAADRDLVARQYANGFQEVLNEVADSLRASLAGGSSLPQAVVHAAVHLMHHHPDSLIARKCGQHVADAAASRAGAVLAAGEWGSEAYHERLADLDFWLRSDGNRRNPGTTADLIAAGLFVALELGVIRPPLSPGFRVSSEAS